MRVFHEPKPKVRFKSNFLITRRIKRTMAESEKAPARNQRGLVRDPYVGESNRRDAEVVQTVWLTESSREIEDTLAELSAAFSKVAADDLESEIGRWLDQLAQQLGAEQCTISEFNVAAGAGFLPQWLAGKHLMALVNAEDSWMRNRLFAGQSVAITSLDDFPAEVEGPRSQHPTCRTASSTPRKS